MENITGPKDHTIQQSSSIPQTAKAVPQEKLNALSAGSRSDLMGTSPSTRNSSTSQPTRLADVPSGRPEIILTSTRRSLANKLGHFLYHNCVLSPGYWKDLAKEGKEIFGSIKNSFTKAAKPIETPTKEINKPIETPPKQINKPIETPPKNTLMTTIDKRMDIVKECKNKYTSENVKITSVMLKDDKNDLDGIKNWAERELKKYPGFDMTENHSLRSLILNCEIQIKTISDLQNTPEIRDFDNLYKNFNELISSFANKAEQAIEDHLITKGYDPKAIDDDYTDKRPESPEAVNLNDTLIKEALDPENQKMITFINDKSEELYKEARKVAESSKNEFCKLLGFDPSTSLQEIREQLVDKGVQKNDPKILLIDDLLYFERMDMIDLGKLTGGPLDVSVKGLFMSKLKREENELNTVKEIWRI